MEIKLKLAPAPFNLNPMPIESQYALVEQYDELANLGCQQGVSLAQFVFYRDGEIQLNPNKYSGALCQGVGNVVRYIDAYSVAEIGEIIIKLSEQHKGINGILLPSYVYIKKLWHYYLSDSDEVFFFPNEAQARSALLIYLIKTVISE